MDTIFGYLERIVFFNEENYFTVARIKEKGQRELTTIIGNMAGVFPGAYLKLDGKWINSKKYGEQFEVEGYEIVTPATARGIERYLGSGLIKGIGPVMARRIVKVFGDETLEIIENNPKKLLSVEGVAEKRVEMIVRGWEEHKDIKHIMIFLQEYGVSTAYSTKIYKQYGPESINILQDNPYRMASEVRGIGFVTADQIAQKMGIDRNSISRAEEGILYVLNSFVGEGHVFCPYDTLVEKSVELLGIDREIVLKAMAVLFENQRIMMEDINSASLEDFVPNLKAVYLPPFYVAEKNLARELKKIYREQTFFGQLDTDRILADYETRNNIKLASKQREAVRLSVRSKVMIVTGGPGTGKTTIIKSILNIYKEIGLRVLLAAPTGRAAKRMQEATGYEARTIHRLLEFSPKKGRFQKDRDNLLDADVIIIDEASMVDLMLMYSLVKAIPSHAIFILVGDIYQLPAVGAGNVLGDMIDSDVFPVITLTEIFRQSRQSKIVTNAHRINMGEFPDTRNPPPGQTSDFYFVEEDDPEEALRKICSFCKKHLPERFGFDPLDDIQVLTPMYKGVIGVVNLNAELQNLLNANKHGVKIGSKFFRIGDKVMQLENNYDKDVFNGDIGKVVYLDQEEKELIVNFDGRRVHYDFSEADELSLAYAISVHKSQGSEYPVVVMPVMTQHYILLQRNLIYTGITRGKKMTLLIGTKRALAIAVKNNKPLERFTMLKERLSGP
ncbi:MAG: ATP-dependent RecD-like DNA helicase [Firmicutes bacterium]|nr:ATP-dependent RecD-like DNA helicase [Bacillota bacterium]